MKLLAAIFILGLVAFIYAIVTAKEMPEDYNDNEYDNL